MPPRRRRPPSLLTAVRARLDALPEAKRSSVEAALALHLAKELVGDGEVGSVTSPAALSRELQRTLAALEDAGAASGGGAQGDPVDGLKASLYVVPGGAAG